MDKRTLQMDPDLAARVKMAAGKDQRSINNMICVLLTEALDQREASLDYGVR